MLLNNFFKKIYWLIFTLLLIISNNSLASSIKINEIENQKINSYQYLLKKPKEKIDLSKSFLFKPIIDLDNKKVTFYWQIENGFKLYEKEIRILNDENEIIELNKKDFISNSKQYLDQLFGQVKVFEHELIIEKPLTELYFKNDFLLKINYQGCSDGICYPLIQKTIPLKDLILNEIENSSLNQQNKEIKKKEFIELLDSLKKNSKNEFLSSNLIYFFLIGVGLSFTPCILPMLPLISNVILGSKERTKTEYFFLTFSYIQGMALSYTLLGILVSLLGIKFSIFLQQPFVLGLISLLFIILAFINFGLIDGEKINLNRFKIFNKINQLNQKMTGGGYAKNFLMGIVAGLVASPCTSAPLATILIHISQTGNILQGGLILYILSLGIGFPLLLISLFGKKILPKSGNWLFLVKEVFGFIILIFPVLLLSRLVDPILLWSLYSFIFIYWIKEKIENENFNWFQKIKKSMWNRVIKIILILLMAISLNPLIEHVKSYFISENEIISKSFEKSLFKEVTTLKELEDEIHKNNDKIILLDVYAKWCASCQKMEKIFLDEEVQQVMKKFINLKIDLTSPNKEIEEITKKYNVVGMPTILLLKSKNEKIEVIETLVGEQEKVKFKEKLKDF